jgi:hypothetical protein
LVVAIAERLVLREPKALEEKESEQSCRDALRKIEVEAANPAKP